MNSRGSHLLLSFPIHHGKSVFANIYACITCVHVSVCVSPLTLHPQLQTEEVGEGGMTAEGGETVIINQIGKRERLYYLNMFSLV